MRLITLTFLFANTAIPQTRLAQNPILTSASSSTIGTNINGPSLIRAPMWMEKPLGRYYLYFAHHAGKFIRLAYANQLSGPWTVYERGTLQLNDVKACHDHIASPDVHVVDQEKKIRMYFHCPVGEGGADIGQQKTLVAFSTDGLHFTAKTDLVGPAYFRVFRWGGFYYAIARAGGFSRSRDGVTPFEQGPTLFAEDNKLILRHAAIDLQGNHLSVYYSRIGDRPERILLSRILLKADWKKWRASSPITILQPNTLYEGADLPLEHSKSDEAPGRVRQLRDPGVFREDGKTYLLYSIAGESGIAIAELRPQ